ncbi:hypothetical protein LXL04_002542 [Taraxacum kok-saghyz]
MVEGEASNPKTARDKLSGAINIRASVPIVLELDRMNYDTWRELLYTYCAGFGVAKHLRPPTDPASSDMEEWERNDNIVKMWIYDSKIMQLDTEICNITMGISTVTEYCNKIQSLADLLENLEAAVPEKNIKSLPSLPSFDDTRSILQLEEQRMQISEQRNSHHHDHPSSPTALTINHTGAGRGHNGGREGGGRSNKGGHSGSRGGRQGGRHSGRIGTYPNGSGGFIGPSTPGGGGFNGQPRSAPSGWGFG